MCLEDEISNRIRISHKFPIFTIAALVARNSIGKTTLLKIQGSAGEESDLQTHHDMLLIPAVIFLVENRNRRRIVIAILLVIFMYVNLWRPLIAVSPFIPENLFAIDVP